MCSGPLSSDTAHQTEAAVLVGSSRGMRQQHRLGFRAAAFSLLNSRPLQVHVREGTTFSDAAGTSTPSPAQGMNSRLSWQLCEAEASKQDAFWQKHAEVQKL
jgi:hypothetical protein